jgi:hypothetical protein
MTTGYYFDHDPVYCPVCGAPLEDYDPGAEFHLIWMRCPRRPFLGSRHYDEPSFRDKPSLALRTPFDPWTGARHARGPGLVRRAR